MLSCHFAAMDSPVASRLQLELFFYQRQHLSFWGWPHQTSIQQLFDCTLAALAATARVYGSQACQCRLRLAPKRSLAAFFRKPASCTGRLVDLTLPLASCVLSRKHPAWQVDGCKHLYIPPVHLLLLQRLPHDFGPGT